MPSNPGIRGSAPASAAMARPPPTTTGKRRITTSDFIREPEGPDSLDFGDAPDSSYPTLLASDGARHAVLLGGFNLGPLIDAEPDGLPHPAALGDDGNNLADEDGVSFVTPLRQARQACVDVQLTAPLPGLLDAWVDFDRNGNWDSGEQIFNGQLLAPGPNPGLCFTVPSGSVPGPTFARFRLSSNGALGPDGFAQDGEVEDYQRVIIPENPTVPAGHHQHRRVAGTGGLAVDWAAQAPYPYQLQHTTNLLGDARPGLVQHRPAGGGAREPAVRQQRRRKSQDLPHPRAVARAGIGRGMAGARNPPGRVFCTIPPSAAQLKGRQVY